MRKSRSENTISLLQALWLAIVLLLFGLSASAAEGELSANGTYRDDQMTVELNLENQSGDHTSYTGMIQLGEQKFPLKADADEGRLRGTFSSQGDQFDFTGTIVGHMLVLTTDGTTYHLKKQIANPLSRPNRSNPLSKPRPNEALSTNRTLAPMALTNAIASLPRVPNGQALKLHRHSIVDDLVIGGEAFSCLVPAGWLAEGGVTWRPHPLVPAFLAFRLRNSVRSDALEVFPTLPFVWADDGIPLFPPGSIYLGNEVAEPILDPVMYIRKILLPRFRKDALLSKVVATEELPGIAEAIAQSAQEQGVEKKFRAARVRFEYSELGRLVQEDIYCVLVSAYVPGIRTTFWGTDRNYGFKAEKGALENSSKIMQVIVDSFQTSLPWFNRYVQLIQVLVQSPANSIRGINDLAACVAHTTNEITAIRRQAFETQKTSQEHINEKFSQYVHGTQRYQAAVDRRPVELPAGYHDVWMNAAGDYLLVDDSTYNPNNSSDDSWQRLAKLPP